MVAQLRHLPRSARLSAVSVFGLMLLWAAPLPAVADANERVVGTHRWQSPMWLSAPATSLVAVGGIAGLAVHLFRRRRLDKRQPPPPRQDDDWERRIAMWEQRLRGNHEQEHDDKDESADDDNPQSS
jgi:hypothetical protein